LKREPRKAKLDLSKSYRDGALEVADVFMIGGANGAGKTTAAMVLLPKFLDVHEFVNADEIARGLNPVQPETADMMAGRVMIERIAALTEAKKNFAFETTCAGQYHMQTLQKCKHAGYILNLIFLWLPSADMAVKRVDQRKKQGGHAIPENTVRRRYVAGLHNLITIYLPMVEKALIIDNSGKDLVNKDCYSVIGEKTAGELIVTDHDVWQQIERVAQGEN
jgi:predicted ABC-type ATPase